VLGRLFDVTIALNHTIVQCRDKHASAQFYVELLGLPPPSTFGPFLVVELANGVSLDFADDHGQPDSQHYAFLVTEPEFDAILGRITERGLTYWADPAHKKEGSINTNDGGRGLYWHDPDGHHLEIITRPYGG